jgi:hypothetical protein
VGETSGVDFWTNKISATNTFTDVVNQMISFAVWDGEVNGNEDGLRFVNMQNLGVLIAQNYSEASSNQLLNAFDDVTADPNSIEWALSSLFGNEEVLTIGIDNFSGQNQGGVYDDAYIGSVSNVNQILTTYNPGDRIDGGEGRNELRLFMDQGATADGVDVSNIQTLELRLNASNSNQESLLMMTDWDNSLEQINITSNKSDVVIEEQIHGYEDLDENMMIDAASLGKILVAKEGK